MKKINKLIIVCLFLFTYVNAKSFYINEPIFNTKVFVQIEGNSLNEPIVLVHGLGDEASTIWKDTINKFKKDYYVVTFDLPGFGKSEKENKELTPRMYSLFIDYLTSLYIKKPFYLIGHSMGGSISLKYTSMFPKKVKKLLLIDAAGILHRDTYSNFLVNTGVDKFFKIKELEPITYKITNILSRITNSIQELIPSDLSVVLKTDDIRNLLFQKNTNSIAAVGLVMEDYSKVVYKIRTPTEILWGEDDDIAPLRTGYVLHKIIPNSKLKIIENSKHVPILDSKDIYLRYVDNFLKNTNVIEKRKSNHFNRKNLLIENQNEVEINGRYKNLKIINSNGIIISSSYIEELIIINSNVEIINSNINSENTAIKVIDSTLLITSSDLKANNAINLRNSKLDVAGSNIYAENYALISDDINIKNNIILSLTRITSKFNKNKVFHTKMIFNKKNRL